MAVPTEEDESSAYIDFSTEVTQLAEYAAEDIIALARKCLRKDSMLSMSNAVSIAIAAHKITIMEMSIARGIADRWEARREETIQKRKANILGD